MYTLKLNEFAGIHITAIKESTNNYYIRILLLYSLRGISIFIKEINDYPHDRFIFELVELSIDEENNLIYLYEGNYTYDSKPKTAEIEELFEQDKFIQLCKIGFLDYIVISKKNFINLLLAWDEILNTKPPFALLYLDDKYLYDVVPFDTQKAMEKFIVDHTKIND